MKPTAIERKQEMLAKLDLTMEQVRSAPQITPELHRMSKTIARLCEERPPVYKISPLTGAEVLVDRGRPKISLPTSPYHFLHASDAPEAKKVLDIYYAAQGSDGGKVKIPIEAYCLKAGVSPLRILEIITATCVRMGVSASTLIASLVHPRIVEKTADMALTDKGHKDRETMHKATGFVPTPKGSQTNINVTQTAQANAQQVEVVAAPSPEKTIQQLVDRFNENSPTNPPLLVTTLHDDAEDEIPEEDE
jgi:hypothetical protein